MSEIETYLVPASIDEAVAALAGGGATVFAGGTDLMPQAKAGQQQFGNRLVNLGRIAEMRGATQAGGSIRIGALTTIAELLDDAVVAQHLPALAEAADHFASAQIRNAASLGGNICNASPAGDTIVPLLLYDAAVELAGSAGRRSVALAEFFTGPGQTVKAGDELLTAVTVPEPKPGFVARFAKSGPRPALEISTVSAGIAGTAEGGALHGVRVAFGAVAPTPIRGRRTEACLEGRALNDAAIAEAAETAAAEVSPINDVRASAWYRRHLIQVFVEGLLADVAGN